MTFYIKLIYIFLSIIFCLVTYSLVIRYIIERIKKKDMKIKNKLNAVLLIGIIFLLFDIIHGWLYLRSSKGPFDLSIILYAKIISYTLLFMTLLFMRYNCDRK